jgi:H+/Cl- antiporter ClcA
MGSNFLAIGLGGGLSGLVFTSLYGFFRDKGHPEYVWYALAAHFIIGILALLLFKKGAGEFKELEE